MAEATTDRIPGGGARSVAGPVPVGHARAWLRFFRSELRQVFLRRRDLLLLAVVALFPILIGVGLRLASHPHGGGGGGGLSFVTELTGNGIFLSFIALSILLTLVMPVVVAVVAGDSIAGEAGYGTLRYLLAVPAGVPGCSRSSTASSSCSRSRSRSW